MDRDEVLYIVLDHDKLGGDWTYISHQQKGQYIAVSLLSMRTNEVFSQYTCINLNIEPMSLELG